MAFYSYQGKRVYYNETGSGDVLIFLHGNTMSSKMFTPVLDLYKKDYKIVTLDFLGHGQSERLDHFETDFWYDQAQQVRTLIELHGYTGASILGTSGGALAAINLALEYPHLVKKVIADSFEGEHSTEHLVASVRAGREMAKRAEFAAEFWKFNHGPDWEQIVDQDTIMLENHSQKISKFFHKTIQELSVPTLFTASEKDSLVVDAAEVAKTLSKKAPCGEYHVFSEGDHPALLTNATAFYERAQMFLSK